MADNVIFHTRDRGSILNKCSPLTKLALMLTACICLTAGSASFTLGLSGLMLVYAAVQRFPVKTFMSQGLVFIILVAFIFITELIAAGSPFLAAVAALRFLFTVLAALLFVDSTSIDDLAMSLGALFYPVLRKYAYLMASAVQLTLSMIPLIFDTAMTIKDARAARGESFLRHPVKSTGDYAVQLISTLLDNVNDMADALSARSYNPYAKRRRLTFSRYDILIAAAAFLTAGACAWTKLS